MSAQSGYPSFHSAMICLAAHALEIDESAAEAWLFDHWDDCQSDIDEAIIDVFKRVAEEDDD